ncbi:hypothetical protein [Acetobacter senegalensis]|uniref:hypothetical protein n=1 Tax=Acetobacter senegalensis TaxID=446692 RepID=UPI001EDCEFDD|nr:hypothetical protein [Acetobacter senegalensis]MCG4273930.1 hypothetical protein [Acetobacter senegalensis]
MDNDQKFWLGIWSLIAATIVSIALIISIFATCDSAKRWKVLQEMVRSGANPMAAACAIDGRGGSDNQYPIACLKYP